ncbi:hypothetical protein [Legionella hackeliae]|uniref:Uncharacterized protein n=1 Tax=Legionella hackeliae TaxID=449 RepID=A0A0A8UQR0_LEGHA|nr:hypothetical protein [Legionella hackeliae]KTD15450.1 hypothetical protein Lhac_0292 [Legionella hackeliae]CEK11180.1 protein of unknown function [Legionella hackeliae]STX47946.1 Uncharacterised protein [Legionella hackeliae]
MQAKTENVESPGISLRDLENKFRTYTLDCGFFRARQRVKFDDANNLTTFEQLHRETIKEVNEQIAFVGAQSVQAKKFGEDGTDLCMRMNNEIGRQRKYIQSLETQLAEKQLIATLHSLNADQLFEETKSNKAAALLVARIPEFAAKIANSQLPLLTHQDPELVKAFTTVLTSREYTLEAATVYGSFRKLVDLESDKLFIDNQENESIRQLLVKISEYLEKKLNTSIQMKTIPWSLGYFGSRHKLMHKNQSIAVPQGIFELKTQLQQLEKSSPRQILSHIQATISKKMDKICDESVLNQIKRFISHLFGYHQSQDTRQDYQYLNELLPGRRP